MVSGHIDWPNAPNPTWQLDWSLSQLPDEEGLVVTNVRYHGRRVLFKGSAPSVRVEYYRPLPFFWMGPFKDRLCEYEGQNKRATYTSRCPFSLVCLEDYGSYFRIGTYFIISAYHLYQSWTFYDSGAIAPRLYSKGLIFPYDHSHHIYWRLDFDLDGSNDNQLLEYNTNTGWFVITNETWSVKSASVSRAWQVRNRSTGTGYILTPGPHDGFHDGFSKRDIWHLRYRANEDKRGRQGNAYDDELEPYLSNEFIDGSDVLWWYAAHVFHSAREPGDEWHWGGPLLYPTNWPID